MGSSRHHPGRLGAVSRASGKVGVSRMTAKGGRRGRVGGDKGRER